MKPGVSLVGAAAVVAAILWWPGVPGGAPLDIARSPTLAFGLREPATVVVVRVEGARNQKGVLRVALFSEPDGFPERSERAIWTATVEVGVPVTEVRFERVESGPWALAVLHDENENERLDRNLFRMPKEGVGASNDAARSGSPRFERALFIVPTEGVTVVVPLHYWM